MKGEKREAHLKRGRKGILINPAPITEEEKQTLPGHPDPAQRQAVPADSTAGRPGPPTRPLPV